MASVCRAWRPLSSSSCLWSTLDLRAHRYDWEVASGVVTCLPVWEPASATHARSRGSKSHATLAIIAARREDLQSFQIESDPLERISSNALHLVAHCCSQLCHLHRSDHHVLKVVALLDCGTVDDAAFAGFQTRRFLSSIF
uniref:F-box domain-containing protein n=1 Tax=Zea mays TaxID=4577 RepID=A0A804PT00_MAIZE